MNIWSLSIISVLVVTIVSLSFCIHLKNQKIDKLETQKREQIESLMQEKYELSRSLRLLDERRKMRDSLADINNRKYEEQIRLLSSANDSTVARIVRGIIAE